MLQLKLLKHGSVFLPIDTGTVRPSLQFGTTDFYAGGVLHERRDYNALLKLYKTQPVPRINT